MSINYEKDLFFSLCKVYGENEISINKKGDDKAATINKLSLKGYCMEDMGVSSIQWDLMKKTFHITAHHCVSIFHIS